MREIEDILREREVPTREREDTMTEREDILRGRERKQDKLLEVYSDSCRKSEMKVIRIVKHRE